MRKHYRQFMAFCKARRGDFLFNTVFAVAVLVCSSVFSVLVKLFTEPAVADWIIPIVVTVGMIGIVVIPIVRELKRPRSVVHLGSGATVGRMIFPVDPVKAAEGTYFESQSVNIIDLIEGGQITGKTCKDCDIWGPAVLLLDGKSSIGGQFEHAKGADIRIELELTTSCVTPPAGVVIVVDTKFDACRFHGIGLLHYRQQDKDEAMSDQPDNSEPDVN